MSSVQAKAENRSVPRSGWRGYERLVKIETLRCISDILNEGCMPDILSDKEHQ